MEWNQPNNNHSEWDEEASDGEPVPAEEEAAAPVLLPPAEGLTVDQAWVLENRPTTARQMQQVDRFRKSHCHFWQFFDHREMTFKNDHLRQNYVLLQEKMKESPRSLAQFSERRRAIIERVIAGDDPLAKDFLQFAFMATLRPMYDHFVHDPTARVANQVGLKRWWNEVLPSQVEHLLSGTYGNHEYPLTLKISAWVRDMRCSLLLRGLGPPMPTPLEIEQRIADSRQRQQQHREQQTRSRQMSLLLSSSDNN